MNVQVVAGVCVLDRSSLSNKEGGFEGGELLGLVAQAYNLSTRESTAVELPQVPGQCVVLGTGSIRTTVV